MRYFQYKGSQVWYVDFNHQGKRYRLSTGTTKIRAAKREGPLVKERAIAIEKTASSQLEKKKPKTFRQTVERYLEEETAKKSLGTQRDEKRQANIFLKLFGNDFLGDISTDDLATYFHKRRKKVGPCTINRERAFLSVLFNHAIKVWRWCDDNPVLRIKRAKEPKRSIYFTDEQFEKMMGKVVEWAKPVVLLGKHTGLRVSNLVSLEWSEVNFNNRVIELSAEKMKNDEHLTLPLNSVALEVLQTQWGKKRTAKKIQRTKGLRKSKYVFCHPTTGEAFTKWGVYQAFRKACDDAKLKGYRFHDLRHTFATHIMRSNAVDVFTLKQLMGHKCLQTTLRYTHVNVEKMRKGVEVLESDAKMAEKVADPKKRLTAKSL